MFSSLQSNHQLNEINLSHPGRGGTSSSAIPVAGTGTMAVGALIAPDFVKALDFFDFNKMLVTAETMVVEGELELYLLWAIVP